MPSKNRTHVSIRKETADRIKELQNIYFEAAITGRTNRVEITEQGAKGDWISVDTIINLAIDELISKRERSRKSSAKRVSK